MSNLRNRNEFERSADDYQIGNSRSDGRLSGFLIGLGTAAILILLGSNLYLLNRQQPESTAPQPNIPLNSAQPQSTNPPSLPSTDTTSDIAKVTSSKTLDLQQNHPNGSTMRPTGMSFADDSITIDLAITEKLGLKPRPLGRLL